MSRPDPGARRSRGFTFFETLIVVVLVALFIGLGVGLSRSALGLSDADRQTSQLLSDHRRNLERLTNVLRNADASTLVGIDAKTGVATDLYFQRPLGAKDGVRILGPEERLVWTPSPTPVSGIPYPGDVYLVGPGTRELAAARVPRDAMRISLSGRSLAVRVTTYHPIGGLEALWVSSTIRVRMRN